MEVKVTRTVREDDPNWEELYVFSETSQQGYAVSTRECFEDPEDAQFSRDQLSCQDIVKFMKLAYDAGKAGEVLEIKEIIEEDL